MRHKPAKSAHPSPLPTDSGSERNRAGIRALDCGNDDDDVAASPAPKRADGAPRERPSAREGTTSLGEQRQSL